ncbi:MAG: hypothetical protein KQI35_05640 [Bacteroidetes bacterium]|nr:hypothetical protein [Bacteroidota bacterium]
MKTKNLLFFLLFTVTILLEAQPPQAFKYQAVVRDASGDIISNETIGVRISIRNDWSGGAVIYQETHIVTTNQFGLITLNIGWGIPEVGYAFLNIDWNNLQKFIEVEVDLTGGGSYISMGTTQLLSVPYSLHSNGSNDWIRDGNNLYSSNSGDIGIGTNVPNAKLDVLGGTNTAILATSSDSYAINGKSSGSAAAGVIGQGQTANSWGVYGYNGYGGIAVRGYSAGGWAGFFAGDGYFSENVGIGTITPTYKLEVNGTTLIGTTSKGLRMRNTGTLVDIESLGTGLALNYQTGENTIMNVISGRVGIGTTSPTGKLEVQSNYIDAVYGKSENSTGVHGYSDNSIGVWGQSISNTGVYGTTDNPNNFAGYFVGKVNVTGTLSKGAGSFLIDHPLDPENKLLRHNFVESPENLLIYRGKAALNSNGEAVVEMPEYFQALTKEDEASIHLTSVGRPFLTGAEWNSDYSAIIIYGDNNREVFWEVLADRDDPVIHELGQPVEEEKGGDNKFCEKGKLLYPKAYGYPESYGRDYEMTRLNTQNK